MARVDPLLGGVFALSTAMLAFQILQVTVLGLQLFPEAGFLVVSLSMLGLGSGGSFAVLLARRGGPTTPVTLWMAAMGFASTAVASMVVVGRAHAIAPIVLASAVPHVFAGLFLASAFSMRAERATVVYAFDLAGAAAGCLVIVFLLDRVGDAGMVVLLVGALAGSAAAEVGRLLSWRYLGAGLALAAALLGLAPLRSALFPFGPEPAKFYGKLLARGAAGGVVERERWNHLGRLDAFRPAAAVGDFDFTRDVLRLLDAGCTFRLLFSNGYNWTYTIDFGAETALRRRYFDGWAQHLPYVFLDRPDVLNLGAGGGIDMYLARLHDARSITGVEINPLMIEAARAWAPEAWDGLWKRPEVRIVPLDARTFVQTTDQTWDVVTLNAVDTGGTQTSLLSANFLYTTEAFGAYLRVLREQGVIFLTRPREQLLRALTAAVAALRAQGRHPERHVVVVGENELLSAAIYASPLTTSQVEVLRHRLQEGEFTGGIQYLPGGDDGPNIFVDYFTALAEGREAEHLATGPLLLTPTTDDQPYFYQLERPFRQSQAWRFLAMILLSVTGIGAVLIFMPLFGVPLPHKGPLMLAHLTYFACLGIGFMLVEIALVTKLGLFLGHPARSLTVTLASLLLASGAGSLTAGRFRHSGAHPAVLAVITILLPLLGPIVDRVTATSLWGPGVRVGVTLALLVPVGVLLGMPFPLQLRALRGELRTLVPWAWAVNGFASVAGSVLAVAIAMTLGFRGTFALAGACYALAAVAHQITRRMVS